MVEAISTAGFDIMRGVVLVVEEWTAVGGNLRGSSSDIMR